MFDINSDILAQLTILGEVLFAIVLGGIVGLEREQEGKPAGFRTHMFIAAATCLVINLAFATIQIFSKGIPNQILGADPIKAFEAIIVGVSFIGGGIIIQNKDEGSVKNLTTAASLLLTACVGIATALQYFVVALGVTVIAYVINHYLLKVKPTNK